MSVIPCEQNKGLRSQIEQFAEVLKTEAHKLGDHGLDEKEFYNSGLFRGAVERVRGQYSAGMREKQDFVKHILNHMEDKDFIKKWDYTGKNARNDYSVLLNSGRKAVIDLKGCLDGNNTNIFERPKDADEFVLWSVCTNRGADPRLNAWSGIHTRLGAEMISKGQVFDGVLIWDMVCGTIGRPCPKIVGEKLKRLTDVGPFRMPPACIYVFPAAVPTVDTPHAMAQELSSVEILNAFHQCFQGQSQEVNYVNFDITAPGEDMLRRTTIRRDGSIQRMSKLTAMQRV